MPAPTTQFFTGRMPFLPPKQQRQSTEVAEKFLISENVLDSMAQKFLYWVIHETYRHLSVLIYAQVI